MQVRVVADIARPPEDVFAFFRDVDRLERSPGARVPVLEKTTPGPIAVGSRFREVVRIFPRRFAQIDSEVIRFEPPRALDYTFDWTLGRARMDGALHYQFSPVPGGGTRVEQVQSLHPHGALRWATPLIRLSFAAALRWRLDAIRRQLESPRAGS